MRSAFRLSRARGHRLAVRRICDLAQGDRAQPAPDRRSRAQTAPFPFPPAAPTSRRRRWRRRSRRDARGRAGDGGCPVSHPVKAKLSSGIFHVPGGQNYERTKPDRCYLDAAAAEADGLRKSLREARPVNPDRWPWRRADAGLLAELCTISGGTSVSVAIAISAAAPLGLGRRASRRCSPRCRRGSSDRADHAGNVLVAHDQHVARGRQVDDVLVDADDARTSCLPNSVAATCVPPSPRTETRFT